MLSGGGEAALERGQEGLLEMDSQDPRPGGGEVASQAKGERTSIRAEEIARTKVPRPEGAWVR